MKKHLAGLVFLLFFACSGNGQGRPGTCSIKGQIISVLKTGSADVSDPCAKHPCRARVKIIEAGDCGSAVSVTHGPGDIIELQFAYTLDNTAKIFPKMQRQYPGLKKGDVFTAVTEQRLRPGSAGELIVFAYEKVKAATRKTHRRK